MTQILQVVEVITDDLPEHDFAGVEGLCGVECLDGLDAPDGLDKIRDFSAWGCAGAWNKSQGLGDLDDSDSLDISDNSGQGDGLNASGVIDLLLVTEMI